MFEFKSSQTIAERVNKILDSHIEIKGAEWLLRLGYADCNDYAEQVRQTVSFSSNNEHVRFETVARYIRQRKAALRKARQEAQTVGVVA